MLSQSAVRASTTTALVARRGFHATRARLASPYHYPEGPRSNLPFNPLTKFFAIRYWGFMGMLWLPETYRAFSTLPPPCIGPPFAAGLPFAVACKHRVPFWLTLSHSNHDTFGRLAIAQERTIEWQLGMQVEDR